MVFVKSVVMSSLDNSLKKAVLSLNNKTDKINGELKLYNFIEEPMGILSVLFLIDGNVYRAGLTRVNYLHYTFGTILDEIPENSVCALTCLNKGESKVVLLGSLLGNIGETEQRLISSIGALDCKSVEGVTQILDDNGIVFDDQNEVEKEIDKCMDCLNFGCEKCVYKDVFYKESAEQGKSKNNEVVSIKKNEQTSVKLKDKDLNETKKNIKNGAIRKPSIQNSIHFFDEISSQLSMLFEKYPEESVLAEIIPNSKWAKVEFEEEKKYYVVGLIYVNEQVKYVCYGVPAEWSEEPPVDFNENAQWLPVDVEIPNGAGYWLTYQDATDGEMVRVDII